MFGYFINIFIFNFLNKNLLWKGRHIHKGDADNLPQHWCWGKQTVCAYSVATKCLPSTQVTAEITIRVLLINELEEDGPDSILDRKGKWNANGYTTLCNFHCIRATLYTAKESGEHCIFQFGGLRISLMLPEYTVHTTVIMESLRPPGTSFSQQLAVRPWVPVTMALLTGLHIHTLPKT